MTSEECDHVSCKKYTLCQAPRMKEYGIKHKPSHRIANRKYKSNNRHKLRADSILYYENLKINDPEKFQRRSEDNKKRSKLRRQTHRLIVLQHYSQGTMKCSCCGETNIPFLTIDHLNGGGRQHRISLGIFGSALYSWLIENEFPEGFSVMCMNCNHAKGMYGQCPHEILQKAVIGGDRTV